MGVHPRFRRIADVELKWEVDAADVRSIPAPWGDSARAENRFFDCVALESEQQIREVAALEAEIIDELEDWDFDDLAGVEAEEEFEERARGRDQGLDLGVCGATLALNLFGCRTTSSCNGAAFVDGHMEDYPLIAFYCDPQTFARLAPILRRFELGLSWSYDALLVYAKDVRVLVDLAVALLDA